MKILVTGANGFIGKNLGVAIAEQGWSCLPITRESSSQELEGAVNEASVVVHLAGVSRPQHLDEFREGNTGFTERLCKLLAKSARRLPVAITSSTQVVRDNPYGLSKFGAETAVLAYGRSTGSATRIYRLPNVFGKWCKPNYNSAIATFCHNVARGLPITINDENAPLSLVYVDDVVSDLLEFVRFPGEHSGYAEVKPVFQTTVGAAAKQIRAFEGVREHLVTETVGVGLVRALYSSYVSYLPKERFSYSVPKHVDPRGVFVEMLKTSDSGQFSFFTAHPGVTRGGHYHHSKTEKSLVVHGRARFKFRQILTEETFSLETCGDEPIVVETIPGWAHDITNIGSETMVVMLWANEIFDLAKPDTFSARVF